MRKYICLFALLLSSAHLFAQGEFIVELDPETGSFTKQGSLITGIHWIYPDVRAYDEVNGRMIFPGGDPIPDHLYTVDVMNGNVISSPLFPVSGTQGTLGEPQFDNTNGTLYGMYHDNTTSSFYLATINPTTGAHAQIGTSAVSGLNGLSQGLSTFNEIHHKYIISSSNTLYSIDAQSGGSVSVPLSLQPGDGMINICFNNGNDTLYGLMYKSSSQLFCLVWIDTATGDITQIGNGTALANGNGGSTIDVAGRRFIYNYSNQNGYHVSVMDLDNGNVLFNNPIVLDNIDNIHSLKYDNVRDKLFAIHWDELIDPSGVATVKAGAAVIYPDPASDELSIRLPKSYDKMQVSLYNVSGQLINRYDLKQVAQHTLQLQDLSAGVYFLRFESAEESFSARFVKQ